MQEDKKSITGLVEKITYRNEANAYTVAQIKVGKEYITAVGTLPFLNEGDMAEFFGEYTVHANYGQQFKVESFERKAPQNAAAILKYLSSGSIKGIGPATAMRIVEKFGDSSLNVIEQDPTALSTIKGISLNKALEISEEYKRQYGVRDLMLLLSKYNVTPDKCVNIYKKYGQKSNEVIKKNPYVLCQAGIDFRFETVEEIAEDNNFDKNSELRIEAGLQYVLRKNLSNGHTCLPRDKFIPVACKLLECKESTAEICCDKLIENLCICCDRIETQEFLSLPEYRAAEEYIAARLSAVKRYINKAVCVEELEIDNIERKLGIKFEGLQRKAILEAFTSGILILTGGPGTGKTTTLNAIISLFESRDLDIELAAPTGRAAKRMTELIGKEAQTIHRLLEVEWGDSDKQYFARNEKNPLDCDVLIVDEASMIDVVLFSNLLKALRITSRIIIVGDSDQLPSIGAGNLLNDILQTNLFPSIRLKTIFRQAKQSMIVKNAHAIINNEQADFTNKESDCFFIKKYDRFEAVDTVLQLVCNRLPTAYNANPLTDIQIICPSRMLETGTVNLNNVLQANLNPHKKGEPQLTFKGFYLRVGDKVMQTKNNYDLQFRKDNGEYGTGIFNGDVGFIVDIDVRAGILKVRFDDKVATYFSEDIGQLELAYAITVHKSQGSEYDYVILPLLDTPTKLMYRNLLYTAITRAKKMLIVVGSNEVWNLMAQNDKKTLRYTLLQEFIKENNLYGNIAQNS